MSPPTIRDVTEVDFLVGQVVKAIHYYGALRIVFDEGDRPEPALYADLETPFTYVDAAANRYPIVPWEPASVGAALTIHGRTVHRVSTDSGALELAFTDGSSIRCEPHDEYEAWHVVGGFPQHLVVCTPGGELAIWDDQSTVETIRLRDLRSE